jgi:hypothetical protein
VYSPMLRWFEAHAPLAIERDTPANPNAGRALLRRLLFEERYELETSSGVSLVIAISLPRCSILGPKNVE